MLVKSASNNLSDYVAQNQEKQTVIFMVLNEKYSCTSV
jgi:hypothetical protein